jgi:hypothetical protein
VVAVGTSKRRASRQPGRAELNVDVGALQDPRAAIFIRRGCAECHAIAALGVKAATDVGPDLTFAYADVVNRYGLTLPLFLDNPRGLMGLVLASHVHLTQSDRDSISHTLEALYNDRLADMDENIPSFPPVHHPKTREPRPAGR